MAGPGGPPPGGGPGGPGGPPPGGKSDEASEDDETSINLLTAATNAYASRQKSADLLSTLSSIFEKAA